MGNFSRDTFDKLKHYVGVRLQQSVPLLDADWNELEDIRRYELQTFLKWFMGNGVPKGNDGFHIVAATGSKNDFIIKGGDDSQAGHCLVEGWDVVNEKDCKYTEQPLYKNEDLAARWGVASLAPLNAPIADRTDTVYLDVWEREVNAEEDENLINQDIGIDTCVRIKREWAVRVKENATTPPDPPPDHVFYHLASLSRKSGKGEILDEHITDLRLTGLSIMSFYDVDQIVQDAFGTEYTQDHDGVPNLKVSLREAINAILKGGLPGTPDTQLPKLEAYKLCVLEHSNGIIWVFGEVSKDGIYYTRYFNETHEWEKIANEFSNETTSSYNVFAMEDINKDIWIFWESYREEKRNIYYRRYFNETHEWEDIDNPLSQEAEADYNPFALEDENGVIWIFWSSKREVHDNKKIIYRKSYDPSNSEWSSDEPLSDIEGDNEFPCALKDSNHNIWVFWQSSRENNNNMTAIYYRRYNSENGLWDDTDTQLTDVSDDQEYKEPCIIKDTKGDIWAFFYSNKDKDKNIYYMHYNSAKEQWDDVSSPPIPPIPLTEDIHANRYPFVLVDQEGDVWVFWELNRGAGVREIYYKRYIHDIGEWSRNVKVTSLVNYENSTLPCALEDRSGDIWLFWIKETAENNPNIYYKKLIPSI